MQQIETLIHEHGETLAAVVLEPGVQGAAGMLTQPKGFLRRMREAADRVGTLLILDEVAVGFGRSAHGLFACQAEGVNPDFLCLAKGLTGGYLPLAATLTTERVYSAFLGPPHEGRTFFHGHTYTGNPLGAAAAHATLDIFAQENIMAQLPEKAAYFAAKLDALAQHRHIGDLRVFGLCAGLELVRDKDTKEAFDPVERRGMKVCMEAVKRGVFLRPLGDVIVLMPPLTLSMSEFDRLFSVLEAAIEEGTTRGV